MTKKIITLICFLSIYFFPTIGIAQINMYDSTLNPQKLDNGYIMFYKDTLNKKALIVGKPAEFRGGLEGYKKFLERNLDGDLGAKYIRMKRSDSIAKQTVEIQFLVSKSGTVSDVIAMNSRFCHPKLVAEAIRVIESSNRWIPAELEMFFDTKESTAYEQAKAKLALGKGLAKIVYRHAQNVTFAVSRN